MQKLPKMKISQTRGVKNTREITHAGFVPMLGLGGPTARHSGDYIADLSTECIGWFGHSWQLHVSYKVNTFWRLILVVQRHFMGYQFMLVGFLPA